MPLPGSAPPRCTGGSTHWKLVPLPHVFACLPFCPKKKIPSFGPSTKSAMTTKPEGAEALAMPLERSRTMQPLAETPPVQ